MFLEVLLVGYAARGRELEE